MFILFNNSIIKKETFLTEIYFPYLCLAYFLVSCGLALFFLLFFRKNENALKLILYVELLMLLLGFLFSTLWIISFSYYKGVVFALILLALSAAESVTGLTILLLYFKTSKGKITLNIYGDDDLNINNDSRLSIFTKKISNLLKKY